MPSITVLDAVGLEQRLVGSSHSSTRSTSSGAVRVKNETSRWCCLGSSTIARSKCAEKMSRTTRTERSASWKTIAGALVSSTRFCEHLVELEQVLHLALEVRALGAVRRGADDRAAAAEVELLGLLAQALALLVLEPARDADALAGGRVDHVAAGDRELHRQPRALGLQRVLDDLDDDLLAGLEQVGDARAGSVPRPRLHLLDARQHDLVDVQEAVLVEADVDERGLQAGQDVVDLALVDVADDRAAAAALEVELRDAVAGRASSGPCCAGGADCVGGRRRRRRPPGARRGSPPGRR